MKSMLFFGRETLISTFLPMKITKLHLSLNHTSSSLTIGNSWTRTRQIFHPAIYALNEPVNSRNGKNNNKMGASIALACIVGIFGVSLKMNNKAIAGPRELYQKAPQVEAGYPLGGRSALKSLLDINVYLSSSDLEPPRDFSSLPLSSRPSAEEINDIKMDAVRLMKYGQPEDAVILLRNAYNFYQYDPEPAYNLEMALVEILISQGKYMEASECNCLKEEQRMPSDGRFPLYKAIICTMLDEKEEAVRRWNEYLETVEGEFDPRISFKM